MCKRYLFIFIFLFISSLAVYSQVTIGADMSPEDFAILQLEGNVGGLRLNNLTTAQRNALSVVGNSSANGLVIYNVDTKSIEMWNGTRWVTVSPVVAANGLVSINDTIKLGGTLQNATTLDMGANNFSFLATTGAVGVGTSSPQAKLDVEGNMRLGTAPTITSGVSALVRNNTTGAVGTAQQLNFTLSNVAPGTTGTITVTPAFTSVFGFLTVSSSNTCSRNMNTIFNAVVSSSDFGTSIVYTNGMARDVVGTATRNSAYSYTVTFPGVAGCADGGNGTQFDFTINTNTPGQIAITNNGNIARNYAVKLSQTL